MAKIKNVVKVMNFHSLLRVDAAKKKAEKYFLLEKEIVSMIDIILNNQNLILDKKILLPKEELPILTIYFGSDFGFCSNYNSQIAEMITKDKESLKIILGKKMMRFHENVLLQCSKDEFESNSHQVLHFIEEGVLQGHYSEIYVVFNHYSGVTDIHIEKRKIYPIDLQVHESISYLEDFTYEGDIYKIVQDMIVLYLEYQLKTCDINTTAAENVLRQNTTNESLKRIGEREEESLKVYRKEKKDKEFRKVIETFSKQRGTRR